MPSMVNSFCVVLALVVHASAAKLMREKQSRSVAITSDGGSRVSGPLMRNKGSTLGAPGHGILDIFVGQGNIATAAMRERQQQEQVQESVLVSSQGGATTHDHSLLRKGFKSNIARSDAQEMPPPDGSQNQVCRHVNIGDVATVPGTFTSDDGSIEDYAAAAGDAAPLAGTFCEPTMAPTPAPTQLATCSALWGQCGGSGWEGPSCCAGGSICVESDMWYSQCRPGPATPAPPTACAPLWGQCGGDSTWTGPTCCASGSACTFGNEWYSQCKPV